MSKLGVGYVAGLMGALVEDAHEVRAGKNWSADVQKRDIIYDRESMDKLSDAQLRGITLHEIGHLKYTPDYHSEYEKANPSEALHSIYNILEDSRIENKLVGELGNFAQSAIHHLNNSIFGEIDFGKIKPYEAELMRLCYKNDRSGTAPNDRELCSKLVARSEEMDATLRPSLTEGVKRALSQSSFEDMVKVIDEEIAPILHLEKDPESSPELVKVTQKNPKGNGKAEYHDDNDDEGTSYYDAVAIMRPYVSVTASRLSQVLKENSAVRFSGAKLSGKLLSKNTYKVSLDERRIFSKRSQPDALKYNVTVVLDNSGSMGSYKQTQAMRGAVLLEGIAKKLGFPFQSYKYDNRPSKLENLRGFEQGCNGGNEECLMLNRVGQDFIKNDQRTNNLLIVITDGQGDSPEDMKPYIDRLVDEFDTTLVAIGIGEDSQEAARAYAPRGMYVPDAEQLPTAIIGFMRKLIHR